MTFTGEDEAVFATSPVIASRLLIVCWSAGIFCVHSFTVCCASCNCFCTFVSSDLAAVRADLYGFAFLVDMVCCLTIYNVNENESSKKGN